jgi:hypothetical protein
VAQKPGPVLIASRLGFARWTRLQALTLDGALAFGMLAIAVALVVSAGASQARSAFYGPIDEVYHVGYVEHVAHTGFPPANGDYIVAGPAAPRDSHATVLQPTQPYGWPVDFSTGAKLSQLELIQAPLYYYALAPIALAFGPHRTVFALRMASVAFLAAAVLLLFLAVRATAPDRPLAAGLASLVLATMSGLTDTLSQVQNCALLIAMFALVYWLLCRDIPRRHASFGLAAAAGCLAVTQIVAAPFAAAAIVWACWRAGRPPGASRSDAARFALPRLAVAAAPVVLWLVWNIAQYDSVFPGGGGLSLASGGTAGGAGVPGPSLSDVLPSLAGAVAEPFSDFWGVGFAPRQADLRPAPLLCLAFVVGGCALLRWGMDAEVRLRLAAWTSLTLAVFLSTFGTLFLVVVRSGGYTSFTGRYFVGVAVAWAALVAVAIDAAAGRRAWILRSASVMLSFMLVRYALQYSTLGFRLG